MHSKQNKTKCIQHDIVFPNSFHLNGVQWSQDIHDLELRNDRYEFT